MGFILPASFLAFSYLIVALQVAHGFPPFYETEQGDVEDELNVFFPHFLGIGATLVISILFPPALFGAGVVSLWCGLRIRKSVQQRTNGPRGWLLTPQLIGVFNKWPMLAFDGWTLGVSFLWG
ncbi:MAG: hypothetical protein ABJL72_07690 [Roseobacter sp.]